MAARLPASIALRRLLLKPTATTTATSYPCRTGSIPTTTLLTQRKTYSTESSDSAPPPLLTKMKADLKTAMRAKDATRLAVLRSIMAATLNASKTDSPIRTDAQLVALLKKTARASQDAVDGFREAGREDLVEKEAAQIAVLMEYAAASGVESLDGEALRGLAVQAKEAVRGEGAAVNMGNVMKKLVSPGGLLEGKDYDKPLLAKIVKEVVA